MTNLSTQRSQKYFKEKTLQGRCVFDFSPFIIYNKKRNKTHE
jgi:hypothetical protein